jgi:hypothetical protein
MRVRHRFLIFGALGVAVGCGGTDAGGLAGSGNGAAGGASGAAGGGSASGGSGGASGGSGGASGGSGSGTGGAVAAGGTSAGGAAAGGASSGGTLGAGGAVDPCTGHGTRVGGGCYVPCTYDPGSPPRYENPPGECTAMGWRCSSLQYCTPNVHCLVDTTCHTYGGPGTVCIPTGPLAGECAISCTTDADCPSSNGATPSPYACRALDTGTTTLHVCRF